MGWWDIAFQGPSSLKWTWTKTVILKKPCGTKAQASGPWKSCFATQDVHYTRMQSDNESPKYWNLKLCNGPKNTFMPRDISFEAFYLGTHNRNMLHLENQGIMLWTLCCFGKVSSGAISVPYDVRSRFKNTQSDDIGVTIFVDSLSRDTHESRDPDTRLKHQWVSITGGVVILILLQSQSMQYMTLKIKGRIHSYTFHANLKYFPPLKFKQFSSQRTTEKFKSFPCMEKIFIFCQGGYFLWRMIFHSEQKLMLTILWSVFFLVCGDIHYASIYGLVKPCNCYKNTVTKCHSILTVFITPETVELQIME